MTNTRVYTIWAGMLQRCKNPSLNRWLSYGGRGVIVCERWHRFENFLADMGEPESDDLSLDRIDTNGNYEPGNCRWASFEVQNRNRSMCVMLTHAGKTMTLTEWSHETGINYESLRHRLKKGWSVDRALTQAIQKHVSTNRS